MKVTRYIRGEIQHDGIFLTWTWLANPLNVSHDDPTPPILPDSRPEFRSKSILDNPNPDPTPVMTPIKIQALKEDKKEDEKEEDKEEEEEDIIIIDANPNDLIDL